MATRFKIGQPYYDGQARDSLSSFRPRQPARKTAEPRRSPLRLTLAVQNPAGRGNAAQTSEASVRLPFLSGRHFFGALLIAVLGVLLVLGLVRANHQAVAFSYEISELTTEKQRVMEINQRLKMELANMTSLEYLEAVARDNLGLVIPQKGQIMVID